MRKRYVHRHTNKTATEKDNKTSIHLLFLLNKVDGTGTVAAEDRLKNQPEQTEPVGGDVVDATPFNENLFLDEEVLDGLEDELNDLDLNDDSEPKS